MIVSISLGSFDWGPLALASDALFGLIAANLVLAVGVALKDKTFNAERFPEYLTVDVLPGLIALLVVGIGVVSGKEHIIGFGLAGVGGVALALRPSMVRNFKALFGFAPPEPPAG